MLYDFMPKYKSMTYKRLKFLLCESIKTIWYITGTLDSKEKNII